MSEVKHTPGPWAWEYYDRNPNRPVALSAGGVDVLLTTGTGSTAWAEVSEADRRLIAAAPDLLAACQRALAVCEANGYGLAVTKDGSPPMADKLKAAILKATQGA